MKNIRPEFSLKDRKHDDDFELSKCEDFDFVSEGVHVYGFIMQPDGKFEKNRPVAIISHGYPGNTSNDDIAYALCRIGFVVIRPFFRGAYGSEGDYLVTNCVEDLVNIIQYVQSGEFSERYKTDSDSTVLIGHSMGGCITVNAAKEVDNIKAVVLMAPFEPYLSGIFMGNEFLENVVSGGHSLKCKSMQDIYDDLISNGERLAFTRDHEKLANSHILLLEAAKDSVVDFNNTLKPFYDAVSSQSTDKLRLLKSYNAGHSFMGCRTLIIEDICSFLGSID